MVFRRRDRADPPSRPLGDDRVAQDMREFAEVFREGAQADGVDLDWESASAQRLDELCDLFLAGEPHEETARYMTMSLGAYLGELLVRSAGGRWVHDHEQRMAAVQLEDGRRCHPHHAAHDRLAGGGGSLAGFYADALG